jgi:hypothetical protein
MIRVHCRPLPETRTANSACAWVAEAEVDGRRFEARSRHGATNALARELVAAGLPDDMLEIHYEGLAGSMRYRSFYEAAGWTFAESAAAPLRRVPYRQLEEPSEGPETLHRPPEKMRFSAADVSLEGKGGEPPVFGQSAGAANPAPTAYGVSSKSVSRCRNCGCPFRPRRKWSAFCSPRCRLAAHRRGKLADGNSGTKAGAGGTTKAA